VRTALSIALLTTLLGCASGQAGQPGGQAATPESCDGVWHVEVTNWLKEQADVHYFDVYGGRTWLGIVHSDETKTFAIDPATTHQAGRAPHVEVESGREFWCSQRWRHSETGTPPNSPNFKVTISCSGGSSSEG